MEFNEVEEGEIYDFIVEYNSDNDFMLKVQQTYLDNPLQLPMLHIYILEKILRFGNKRIYKQIIMLNENNKENFSLNDINLFTKAFYNDTKFREFKLEQLKESPETLLDFEKLILELILGTEIIHKKTYDKLDNGVFDYDLYTPILYDSNKEFKKALTKINYR